MTNETELMSVVRLETVKTDVDKAKEFKAKLQPLLDQACAILTEAHKQDIQLEPGRAWKILCPNLDRREAIERLTGHERSFHKPRDKHG